MKKYTIVILAAGIGSRLRPLTEDMPKCMADVAGEKIIERQIRILKKSFNNINVVVGYQREKLIPLLNGVKIVINENYETTNNMYSLYLAKKNIPEENGLIILNGDIVFDENVVEILKNSENENVVLIKEGEYFEESMKITVDNSGKINGISKKISKEDAFGTSIDFYRFSKNAKDKLFEIIESIIATDKTQWTEVAVNQLFEKVDVYPLNIHNNRWYEIDTGDDLIAARKLFEK